MDGVLAASLLYFAQSGRFAVHELLVAMFLFVTAPVSALMLAGAHSLAGEVDRKGAEGRIPIPVIA